MENAIHYLQLDYIWKINVSIFIDNFKYLKCKETTPHLITGISHPRLIHKGVASSHTQSAVSLVSLHHHDAISQLIKFTLCLCCIFLHTYFTNVEYLKKYFQLLFTIILELYNIVISFLYPNKHARVAWTQTNIKKYTAQVDCERKKHMKNRSINKNENIYININI